MKNSPFATQVIQPDYLPPVIKNYRTNFFGNKKRLLTQILKEIPEGTNTIADVFGGTGIVAWTFKNQGYQVIANDVMRYPSIRMKALVENQSTSLSNIDLDQLCSNIRKSGEMNTILEIYKISFGVQNCRFLEAWANNIKKLDNPIKKNIAVYIPVAVISTYFKYSHIHWGSDNKPIGLKDMVLVDLEKEVRNFALNTFPNFVHDNGKNNHVYNQDALSLIPEIEADVLYLDPPYSSKSGGSYEADYGFLDDLVSLLKGEDHLIKDPTDSKCELAPYTYFGSRTSAITGLAKIFECSLHIPTLIISYNDTSNISPNEIMTFARIYGREVTASKFLVPLTCNSTSGKKTTNEYLISCSRKAA
ncbi:DNA adenine methylase [Kiritimatiellota bacterium B12222]|nr:DNA adenine methylase [Kiritimatiellota bacterium B12222]